MSWRTAVALPVPWQNVLCTPPESTAFPAVPHSPPHSMCCPESTARPNPTVPHVPHRRTVHLLLDLLELLGQVPGRHVARCGAQILGVPVVAILPQRQVWQPAATRASPITEHIVATGMPAHRSELRQGRGTAPHGGQAHSKAQLDQAQHGATRAQHSTAQHRAMLAHLTGWTIPPAWQARGIPQHNAAQHSTVPHSASKPSTA
jgi:hypothetical protein